MTPEVKVEEPTFVPSADNYVVMPNETDEVESVSFATNQESVDLVESCSDHEQDKENQNPQPNQTASSPPPSINNRRKRLWKSTNVTAQSKPKARKRVTQPAKTNNEAKAKVNVVNEGFDAIDSFVPNLPEFLPNPAVRFRAEEAGEQPCKSKLDFFNLFMTNELFENILT